MGDQGKHKFYIIFTNIEIIINPTNNTIGMTCILVSLMSRLPIKTVTN